MTDTTYTERLLGQAWPGHFNKAIAEAMYENIKKVGLADVVRRGSNARQGPAEGAESQSERAGVEDHASARALAPRRPAGEEDSMGGPPQPTGGGSDDIGDISWNVPTVVLSYPSNIPGGPGHNWANGVAMATPIAHKGVVAGAKVQALTMLDILLHPEIIEKAWDYFNNVQTKETKYKTFIRDGDVPAIWLNKGIMEKYRPQMKTMYYDPSKYDTYLEQLGIKYPTVRDTK